LYAGVMNGGRTIGRRRNEKVGLRTGNDTLDDDKIDRLAQLLLYGFSIKVEYGYEGEKKSMRTEQASVDHNSPGQPSMLVVRARFCKTSPLTEIRRFFPRLTGKTFWSGWPPTISQVEVAS
jgi:hypothetical protein